MIFDDLDLNPELLESIDYMGFSETTPIQEKAIPVILSGRDLIGCAQTGTGKTAAYLLPVMNNISEKRPDHTHTLILVPTRELALQIDQQIQGLAYTLNITSISCIRWRRWQRMGAGKSCPLERCRYYCGYSRQADLTS